MVTTVQRMYQASITSVQTGLIAADRTPHPHLSEVKKIYQNIKSELVSNEKGITIKVKNWFDFTDLNAYQLNWQIVNEIGKVIAKGTQHVDCAPHETTTITTPCCFCNYR